MKAEEDKSKKLGEKGREDMDWDRMGRGRKGEWDSDGKRKEGEQREG